MPVLLVFLSYYTYCSQQRSLYLYLLVMPFAAHSCLDFVDLAFHIKKAFKFCKVVEQLDYFANFKDTVDSMKILNVANTTPGADHFGDFRYNIANQPFMNKSNLHFICEMSFHVYQCILKLQLS